MEPGRLVHVRIAARDPARAARFYADCFGWTVGELDDCTVRFLAPGGVAGSFWGGGEPSSAGPELYVGVPDVVVAVARAVQLGAMRIARPGPGPDGATVASLLDPEGNRVCVWEAPGSGKERTRADGNDDAHE